MKRGVFNTTWKQNDRACSGKHRIHLGRKAPMSRSQVKTLLVYFFDHKSIVHYEFIAQRQMVNQQCYLEVLTRLREFIRRKRPVIWPDKWILHHNSAPEHDALRVREFQSKNSITKINHPPYSPDLALCEFWLFPKLKKCPEVTNICDLSNIQRNVKKLLRGTWKTIFKTVSGSGTIVSRSAFLHKESTSKAIAAASAQVSKFFFHRAIPRIKLSHLIC